MSTSAEELRSRNLRTVLALAALFFLPVALAMLLYWGSDWRPTGRSNHGELLEPARALPRLALPRADGAAADANLFTGRWSVVYLGEGPCDQACREALQVMQQARFALHKDMTRVQRVMLAGEPCCDLDFLGGEHEGLVVLDAGGAEAGALLAQFPREGRDHRLFIVDPHGNLIMQYDARGGPAGLRDDLKRLLKLSRIG